MKTTATRRTGTAALLAALVVAPLTSLTASPAYADPCTDVSAAVVTVDETTPVTPGTELHLSGSGFCPGQRLAIKMDRDAYGQLGADAAENVPGASRERIEVGVDGTFTAEPLLVPRYAVDGKVTEAGNHLVHLLDNEPVTTVAASFATAATYATDVDTTAAGAPGGTLRITGTGWLDRAGTGSSTVGVVLEEAGTTSIVATEHVAGHAPHANSRIWAVVPATAFTAPGTFAHDVTLPDGTTAGADGSTVAFGGKSYRVRLWSGQQLGQATDISRNAIVSADFAVSAPPAPKVVKNTKKPVIKGTAKVGKKVTATKGSWNTTVTVKFQWLRNGKVIKGATKATYKVTAKDRRKKLTVRVTASKAGWTGARAVSKAVKVA
ncbi:MAG: hypothetical protein ACI379_17260 [Nocardioides sp.]|uniref:hypothetical protein n=1 Tax=Nocardioides sp. TaxID=35761 RepID=UPI003F0539A4